MDLYRDKVERDWGERTATAMSRDSPYPNEYEDGLAVSTPFLFPDYTYPVLSCRYDGELFRPVYQNGAASDLLRWIDSQRDGGSCLDWLLSRPPLQEGLRRCFVRQEGFRLPVVLELECTGRQQTFFVDFSFEAPDIVVLVMRNAEGVSAYGEAPFASISDVRSARGHLEAASGVSRASARVLSLTERSDVSRPGSRQESIATGYSDQPLPLTSFETWQRALGPSEQRVHGNVIPLVSRRPRIASNRLLEEAAVSFWPDGSPVLPMSPSYWLFDRVPDLLCITSSDGRIRRANASFERLLGLHPEMLSGRRITELVEATDAQYLAELLGHLHPRAGVRSCETRCRNSRAEVLWISWKIGLEDTGGLLVFSGRDITERKQLEARLTSMVTTDSLTQVFTRAHFLERASEELSRTRRYGNPMAVLMMDVDRFKTINDRYGHQVGDQVLTLVADRCRRTLRSTDIIGRMGGEEFAAVLVETGRDAAVGIADRIRSAVEGVSVFSEGLEVRTQLSIGLTDVKAEDMSIERVLKRADQALYEAKEAGRNRVAVAFC